MICKYVSMPSTIEYKLAFYWTAILFSFSVGDSPILFGWLHADKMKRAKRLRRKMRCQYRFELPSLQDHVEDLASRFEKLEAPKALRMNQKIMTTLGPNNVRV